MASLIQNIVESSLSGVLRAYNEWLGPRFHITRIPKRLGNDRLITFNVDRTEKHYTNWLVWTVHNFAAPDGSDIVMRVRVKVSGDDVFEIDLEATGEYAIDEALEFNAIILKDLHDELKAYTTREGWSSDNVNVY